MQISNAEKIYEIMEKFRRNMMNKKMSGEIPRSEFKLLKVVQMNSTKREGVTISSLSDHLGISKSAVSQMINLLEDEGYIERVFTKNDRRLVYVRLTDGGEKYIAQRYQKFLESMTEIFNRMGEKDTEELLRLLEKLYDIVTEND
ncbi:MarR family winged helix-turn-helix transcriptional regulator [Desulfitobacterium sp.]|uniref:MarR family winged helix-turn-helix transcriptional regulator n=1 Tax=Desulfitobacterium sp. TaxID=49981 RepID=UPI002B208EE0|nr:MarR family transcriptional regulator [Desulfitobacterium sp.]MEA4903050.1 MarR family transcriptional regulator [Desulfitobacterium sp.]